MTIYRVYTIDYEDPLYEDDDADRIYYDLKDAISFANKLVINTIKHGYEFQYEYGYAYPFFTPDDWHGRPFISKRGTDFDITIKRYEVR